MNDYRVRLRITAWATVTVAADSAEEAADVAEGYSFGDFDIDDVSDSEAADVELAD